MITQKTVAETVSNIISLHIANVLKAKEKNQPIRLPKNVKLTGSLERNNLYTLKDFQEETVNNIPCIVATILRKKEKTVLTFPASYVKNSYLANAAFYEIYQQILDSTQEKLF